MIFTHSKNSRGTFYTKCILTYIFKCIKFTHKIVKNKIRSGFKRETQLRDRM